MKKEIKEKEGFKETKKEIRRIKVIEIEETFRKIKGIVYWVWRFCGEKKWRFEKTAYKEIPWIKINLRNLG